MLLLKCLHCGFECKGLTLHLKYKHKQTPTEYREQFPGAEIFSKSVRARMSDSNHLKGKTYSFDDKFGDKSNEIKQKIGKNSGAARKGKRRPGQADSLKLAWAKNKETWSSAIAAVARLPENREKKRKQAKDRIEKNGYHLSRGRETTLEKFVRETLQQNGYEVVTQKGTKKETLGVVRFFDIFVPSLNLLIECDGEYWHSSPSRIKIDLDKNNAAKIEGYRLLRISDKQFTRSNKCAETLLSLLNLSDDELKERSSKLIQDRLVKLNP
jgi:very-short-patch-repair endonuclease